MKKWINAILSFSAKQHLWKRSCSSVFVVPIAYSYYFSINRTLKIAFNANNSKLIHSCLISGDLYIVESCNLHLRYAEVRDGNLLLYRYNGRLKEFHIRIPLYNLSINLDFSRQNGQFSLTRYSDLTPLATFQVSWYLLFLCS